MPKKTKRPRLPNGLGQISHLSGNRSCPYAVYPPSKRMNRDGRYIREPAICYVPTYEVGVAVLISYKAGTYKPGDEIMIANTYLARGAQEIRESNDFVKKLMADYSRIGTISAAATEKTPTFAEVFEEAFEWRYLREGVKRPSKNTMKNRRVAFGQIKDLHDKEVGDFDAMELQRYLDALHYKYNTKQNIKVVINLVFEHAKMRGYIPEDISKSVNISGVNDTEHGIPLTRDELRMIWENRYTDPMARSLVIMCMSGYRISAFDTLEVNLGEWYFKGGVKTAAGKGRIVPIHSQIRDLVKANLTEYGSVLAYNSQYFSAVLRKWQEGKFEVYHTAHDCRHTFSALCEFFDVQEKDRKRLLGHSLASDITNDIYGHRGTEELRMEIEKIDLLRYC